MALPTMQGYWSSRKNFYEQAIVRQRNQQDDFHRNWSQTADYFKTSDVRAAKQQAWSSTPAYQDRCTSAYQSSVESDIKASNLKRRRDKLASLLLSESKAYQAELKGYSKDNFSRLEEMKARTDELRSAREEKRQQVAEEKLYQHWRENNPDMRRAESRMMEENVIGAWGDQKVEKDERLESARREREAFEEEMERERQTALDLEREKEEQKLREEKTLKEYLREQMMELKTREAQSELWKKQEEQLLRHQWELEQIEEQRRQREEEHKKKDLGRALLRQHKVQMMRKSKLIQEELEQDKQLLDSLIQKEKEEVALHTARKEKARADAHWMKEVIEDQLRVEKAREAELDMLYQDEAARMWQKREAEWSKERQARQRLMNEVLEARQGQIEDKVDELRQQQEESLQRREELLREMELAQQMTRRDEEQAEQHKKATRLELEEQIQTLREREKELKLQLEREQQDDRRAEEDYEELLRQETQRLKLRGYTPRDYGRKQAWM